MINDLLKKVYDQKIEAGQIDQATWQYNTDDLWKAVREGWGKAPAIGSAAQLSQLELRRNVNVYAAFKNHSNVIELTKALTKDGKPLTFGEFKKLAKPIAKKYNETWLRTEYNYATRSANSAAQWQRLKLKGGKIEYKTIRDGRVRDEHRKLNGIILPVDHLFWTNYFPPNGWNCRCFVRSRPDDTENNYPTSIPDVNPMFENNVGITGNIFTNDHPFIKEAGEVQGQKIRAIAELFTKRFERKEINKLAIDQFVGKTTKVELEGFSADVKYGSKRIDKAVSQPHKNEIEKNRALLNIDQLMKTAKFFATAPNMAPWKTNVKQYHYLLTTVGDDTSYIVLEEMNDGEIYFYSIVDRLKG